MIRSSTLVPVCATLFMVLAGCGEPNSSTVGGLTFDPCQPLAVTVDATATAAQRQGISDALALWNADAGTHLTIADAPDPSSSDGAAAAAPAVALHFQDAAPPFHGLYDPDKGQIFINSDLLGAPEQITVAHEVGHAFGLVHVSGRQSVMNAGNLTIEPNARDAATLAAMWGSCNSP